MIIKKISGLLLQGLLAILPVILSIYAVYWLGTFAESTLGFVIRFILPDAWYIHGLGILAGFAVAVAVGLLLKAYIFQKAVEFIEDLFRRIPIVKTVYSTVKDIAKFISESKGGELQTAVLVKISEEINVVGFVTNRNMKLGEKTELIAIYIPMSYQFGGFTLFLPKEKIVPLDMSSQEAMRLVLTAAMGEPKKKPRKN